MACTHGHLVIFKCSPSVLTAHCDLSLSIHFETHQYRSYDRKDQPTQIQHRSSTDERVDCDHELMNTWNLMIYEYIHGLWLKTMKLSCHLCVQIRTRLMAATSFDGSSNCLQFSLPLASLFVCSFVFVSKQFFLTDCKIKIKCS